MPSQRQNFLDWLLLQEGKTSLWGAKGPECFDCSGLVTCGYLAVGLPDWRQTHNADGLWRELAPIDKPSPGDLALYGGVGDRDINHVMVWVGDERVYGACGASHHLLTVALAKEAGARVRFRPVLHYRTDFRGFRRSPFTDEVQHAISNS